MRVRHQKRSDLSETSYTSNSELVEIFPFEIEKEQSVAVFLSLPNLLEIGLPPNAKLVVFEYSMSDL